MPKFKFCANISWLYGEADFMDRYRLARADGFKGVEMAWPYQYNVDELVRAKQAAGIEQVLINSGCSKSLGNAANSNNVQAFRDELDAAIKYARALDCSRIHVMSGKVGEGQTRSRAYETYVDNMRYAAGELNAHGLTGLIEPINKFDVPDYFLSSTAQAVGILELVDRPNLRYQLDVYHLQITDGALTRNLRNLLPRVGHVQVSQVPGRNEPSAPGEINYRYVFEVLELSGYSGWVGCEYKPSHGTSKGLKWFKDYVGSA